MEPLIRLRLLASDLDNFECNRLIQDVVWSFGSQAMLSMVFNHLTTKYNDNGEHDPEVGRITTMISKILNKRKKGDSETKDIVQSKNIAFMPPQIIGECASYLRQNDYMKFTIANRSIYCATNSPITLRELDVRRQECYEGLDLHRFALV